MKTKDETPKQRMFPIMRGVDIPWEVIAPFDKQAQANHGGQTLERLAQRGGLGECEAVAVLEQRRWTPMDEGEARKRLRDIVEAHHNSPLSVALRANAELVAALGGLLAGAKPLPGVQPGSEAFMTYGIKGALLEAARAALEKAGAGPTTKTL